jgi:hypothetical protein
VDVAGVSLALVGLGHERDGHSFLRGDFLRAVLVNAVVVGARECLRVLERDLVLTEIAFALGAFRSEAGASHVVADPAQQWLDPGRTQQRVVDVVEVGRIECAVAAAPGVLVAVAVDDELEFGAGERGKAVFGQPSQLAAQDLAG